MSRLIAVAAPLGENPFIVGDVMDEADLSGSSSEIKEDSTAALDKVLSRVIYYNKS